MSKTLRCSFCGRHDDEVEKLVAGPRVYICDRCADEVMRIMRTTPPADVTPRKATLWQRATDAVAAVKSWFRVYALRPVAGGSPLFATSSSACANVSISSSVVYTLGVTRRPE